MATDQAAFNATLVAIQQNQITEVVFIDGEITDADCILLANALKNNTSVQYLDLASNFLGDTGAIALAQALQINRALQTLGLENNSISDSGAIALAQALQVNTDLQGLYLGINSIGNSGTSAIAQALQTNTALQFLELNYSSINDSGAIAFAQVLQVNRVLKYLDLSATSITDNGTSALAQALQVNTVLQTLYLTRNSIGDNGASAIAQALQVNAALQILSLAVNSIGDSGAIAIAQDLQGNTQLQWLDMDDNSIGASGANAFAQALQCNYVLQTLRISSVALPGQLSGYLQRNVQCAAAAAQCPILVFEPPATISPNTMIPLRSANLRITNVARTQTLLGNFTVDAVSNGQFVNATQQILTEFSQAEVNATQVFIKTDNSGLPFSCNITASFGGLSTCAIPLVFNVTTTISTTTTPTITTTTSTMPTSTITSTTTSRPFTTTRTPTTNATASTLPLTTSSQFFSTTTIPSTTSMSRTSTSVVKNPGGGAKMQSTNLGVIIGGVVGGVAGVAAVGVGVFLLNRRRHRQKVHLVAVVPHHSPANNVTGMVTNPVYAGAGVVDPATDMTHNPAYRGATNVTAPVYEEADDVSSHDYVNPDPAAIPQKWIPSQYTTVEPAAPTRDAQGYEVPIPGVNPYYVASSPPSVPLPRGGEPRPITIRTQRRTPLPQSTSSARKPEQ